MGILARFKNIMASNINALLDKCEDPEKMIDQTLRNINEDLRELRSETATVIAEEKRTKRLYDETVAEEKRLQDFAIRAVEAGNDEDARKFLAEKQSKANELVNLEANYKVALNNSLKMKKLHDKLQSDVNELEGKRAELKAKFKAAKAQEKINDMISGATDGSSSISAFEKYEQKANAALDKAQAESELLANEDEDEIDDLMDKYANPSTTSTSIDDELAALKASLKK